MVSGLKVFKGKSGYTTLGFFNIEETECRQPVVKTQQTTHSLHSLSHDFFKVALHKSFDIALNAWKSFTIITTRTHTRPRKVIMIIITKNNQCFHTNNTMLFFRNHHYLITFFTIVFCSGPFCYLGLCVGLGLGNCCKFIFHTVS